MSDNTKHWQENRETKPLIYLQVCTQNGIVMWKIVWWFLIKLTVQIPYDPVTVLNMQIFVQST